MAGNTPELRTKLSRVKGLGAAHHGTDHFWMQRVTAVALVPLSVWFMASLLSSLLSPNVIKVVEWFASPIHSVLFLFLLIAGLVHARLGVQVVVEDYIKGPFAKYGLLILNYFLCVALIVIGTLATLRMHFLDIFSATM